MDTGNRCQCFVTKRVKRRFLSGYEVTYQAQRNIHSVLAWPRLATTSNAYINGLDPR